MKLSWKLFVTVGQTVQGQLILLTHTEVVHNFGRFWEFGEHSGRAMQNPLFWSSQTCNLKVVIDKTLAMYIVLIRFMF